MNQYIKPTPEQEQAIELFQRGCAMKINAFAGTGKTKTLMMLSKSTQKSGMYLAFNRSLANEARRQFPRHVICKTTHQIAYHATPDAYKQTRDKMHGTVNSNRIAQIFHLKEQEVTPEIILSPRLQGAMILETVRRFMQSRETVIIPDHVPRWGKVCWAEENEFKTIQKYILRYAHKLWLRMIDPDDPSVPLGHDGYFKLWALSDPSLPGEYILLDEAQDTNPVMLGVLANQSVPVVYVGDKYQQIYEWRGAINAMEQMETECETSLTQSFRFGTEIAKAATRLLRYLGEYREILGNKNIHSSLDCQQPDVIICRTHIGLIENLLRAVQNNQSVYLVGGQREILRLLYGVSRLKEGISTDLPELYGFDSWIDVVDYAESDEGAALRTLVRMIELYSETCLIRVLSGVSESPTGASIGLSTAHKSKGLEWDNVLIHDDFSLFSTDQDGRQHVNEAEMRLFYVALTRAQHSVGLPPALMV